MANDNQKELVKAPKRVRREILVTLTQAEKDGLMDKLGELGEKKKDLAGKAKVALAEWKNKINAVESEIGEILETCASKKVEREVECEERFDYRLQQVDVVVVETGLVETGKTIHTRPMTPEERQPTLPLVSEEDKPTVETPPPPESSPKPKSKPNPKKRAAARGPREVPPAPANDAADPDAPPDDHVDETAVTDPQTILEDAADDGDFEP